MTVDDNDPPVSKDELVVDQNRQNVHLEGDRLVRAENLQAGVDDKAVKLAVKQALREAHVDGVLTSHTQRLDQISGAVGRLDSSVGSIKDALHASDKKLDTSIAVGAAVAEKSISTRTFIITVAAIAVPTGAYLLTTVH